jgi:hypothetical protein
VKFPRFIFCLSFCIVSIFASSPVMAQKLPRLAVLPFTVDSNEPLAVEDAGAMRRIVHATIAASGRGEILFNGEADKIIKERDINLREIFRTENLAKLQEANLQYVVTGFVNVNEKEKTYRLRLSLMKVESGEFLLDVTSVFSRAARALSNAARKQANEFMEKIIDGLYLNYIEKAEYAVGDTGPAGGIIFYVKLAKTDGWRYLEAAPRAAEFKAAWGYYTEGIYGPDGNGTDAAVGSGQANTMVISGRTFGNSGVGNAAQFCELLDYNNYEDWYLPAKDELYYMYLNLAAHGIGGFSDGAYWTSTQSAQDNVWFQTFNDGKQYYNGVKTDVLFVRAVRAF